MLQVGVKAPGTAKSTTLRPAKTVSVVNLCVPSAVMVTNSASGKRSPTLIMGDRSSNFASEREEGLVDHDILFKANIACRHGQGQGAARERDPVLKPVDAQMDQPALAGRPRGAEVAEIIAFDKDIEILVEALALQAEGKVELAVGFDERRARDPEGRLRVDLLRHACGESLNEARIARIGRGLDQRDIELHRDADDFANAKEGVEGESDGLSLILGDDIHRKDDAVLIADSLAPFLEEALRRRP